MNHVNMLPSSKLLFFLISWVIFVESNSMEINSRNPLKVDHIELSNGQKIPAIGFGSAFGWPINSTEVENAVKVAVDLGFRHFDCAFSYGTEQAVGKALNDKIKEGVVTRKELFVISKLWINQNEKGKVVPACKKSVSTMGLDYLDMYLVHFPFSEPNGIDYVETWRGMEDCVKLGLTHSIGVSNFNISQLERLLDNAIIKPVVNQVEVHVNMNQKKMRDYCSSKNITVVAYSPFGAPARNSSWQLPSNITVGIDVPEIKQIAQKYNKTSRQVALRYLIDIGTIPIPKASKENHLYQNLDVFNFKLTPEEVTSIDKLNINLRTNHAFPYKDYLNYPFVTEEN